MKKYGYYLFDFDGTLFDSLACSTWVFREAYAKVGVIIRDEDVPLFTREPMPVSYERLGAPKEQWPLFEKTIYECVNSGRAVQMTGIFPETFDVITDLFGDDATLGIVTSNGVPHVKSVLKKFNLHDGFFTILVGNQEAPVPKPDPSPILKALEMAGNPDRKNVIYVGDALNDCLAAERAGVDFVLLDRKNEFADSGYPIIHSLDELL